MTLTETTSEFALLAGAKTEFLRNNPLGFLIAAMMAGAYVGVGILLIFSVGESVDPSVRNLVMGCSFGIALTLVIFAGSELFTGYTMYMTLGLLAGVTSTGDSGTDRYHDPQYRAHAGGHDPGDSRRGPVES